MHKGKLCVYFFFCVYIFFEIHHKTKNLKWELHYQIYSTFSPHLMCWKYFQECFKDKNLLHISLTNFNKLNKRRKHTFLTTQFEKTEHKSLISDLKNSFYMTFALLSFYFQHIFSLSLSGFLMYTCFRTIFLT